MADISLLHPMVRVNAQYCPDFTINHALNRAAREFCDETYFLKHTITQAITNTTSHYDLSDGLDEEEIIAVKNVQFRGVPLQFYNSEAVPMQPGFPPQGVIFYPPATIELVPYPDESSSELLYIEIVTKPILDSDIIPDELYRRYDRAIVSGALSYLLAIPNEAWTNHSMSVYYRQQFARDVLVAKSDQMFGHVSRNSIIRPYRYLI